MPYIKKEFRNQLDSLIDALSNYCLGIGDWNYAITKLLHKRIQRVGIRYKTLNDNMGILESAKQEFYRTVVTPYEDKKRKENGSISELDKEKSNE